MKYENKTIYLQGEHVILRKPEPDDLDLYYRLVSDEQIAYFSDDRKFKPISRKDYKSIFEKYILTQNNGYYPLVIVNESNGFSIGQIHSGKIDYDNNNCYIGFQILPEFQRRGLGSDAVMTFLDYLFYDIGMNRVAAEVYEYNQGSISLMQSLGFTNENRLRKWLCRNGKYFDKIVYSILKDEWAEESRILSIEKSDKIVMLFDLTGYDNKTKTMSDEEQLKYLNEFWEYSGALVEKFGGKLIKFIGDRGLAIFSQELSDNVDSLSKELKKNDIRNTYKLGKILLGNMGVSTAEHYDIFGKVVNDVFSEMLKIKN